MKKNKKKLDEALYKKALGYTAEEVSEEYAVIENELVLQKRKTNTKTYPPDLSALKLLLDELQEVEQNYYSKFSLDELEQEREKLKKLLEGENNEV